MSVKRSHTIDLKDRQFEYLERMMKKHDIPDIGKVLRILIDYAMHEPQEESRIFTEMRCSGC